MLKWLKRHFIPHIDNAYRPHFLLGENLRQLLAVVIGFELLIFALPIINFVGVVNQLNLGAVLPGVLSALTNSEREKNNLPDLVENPLLMKAAQLKAEDMAAKSYFAHTSPEGRTPWFWLDQVGYSYDYAGENLAVNFIDSEEVAEAWMSSPTHRANIVGGNYSEIGTGIATGIYQGRETVFVAQVYARSAAKSAPLMASITQPPARPISNLTVETKPVTASQTSSRPVEEVLGETLPVTPVPTEEPNFIQTVFSSPRQAASAVLYVCLAILLIALFLNISIKFDQHHPDLIANGLAVVVILFAINIVNGYIVRAGTETSFLAYESPQTVSLSR